MTPMRWLLLVALAGCYKDPHVGDCEIACTDSCPSGLQCVAGACREPGMTGACTTMPSEDAGTDAAKDAAPGVDTDGDTIPDTSDNCPTVANKDQANEDGDQLGDLCDPCPVDADNTDTDNDGIGDKCDPHPSTGGDHLALFEGFNTATLPVGATASGAAWMFDPTMGVAKVTATAQARLTWANISATHIYISAKVTLSATQGLPSYVGTLDRANGGAGGFACVNAADANGNGAFGNDDTVTSTAVTTSAYVGVTQPNVIYESYNATNPPSWSCRRDDNTTVPDKSVNEPGSDRGLFADHATGIFHWIMIVTSP